ncbi:bifunctional chorismate mutase/prephenate dehydratase [Mailhella massiliensis]|uniref:Bifunctional chorismate mutase/prephenate dehydratase n=1 Tax=Mailhella massiliensis TaxID=1903261 RepID=A0A921DR91_9BACT|nr:bifunctional chorismate mutase/prephenate dehydratase [Mailhella massiliensis]HJD97430.1 bifunctional chorismate mutase/prephenate dehydratase [Mailhella massiliensis]
MAEPFQIPGLAKLREEIDAVDSALLELLNRRAGLSLAVGQAKRQVSGKVFDPAREAQLLERLAMRNKGPLEAGHVSAIWRAILSASRSLQKNCTVAYLGPEGTFSYFAAVDFLGASMDFTPCRDFHEIFRGICLGHFDLGVIPLENSIHGTIAQSFDLFSEYEVSIQAEFYSRISNSLLSGEKELSGVKTVYSHPQPLGQCASWLRANLPQARLVSVESTAAAAWKASCEEGAASIGHRSMAEKLGMNCLACDIQDDASNWTRFVLVAAGDKREKMRAEEEGGFKSSLLFTVPNRAGTLAAVLNVFTSHKVNLTKLESRPLKGAACWDYIFFADVECDLSAPTRAGLIRDLGECCSFIRVLGCYPEGPRLDSTANTTGF